MTSGEEVSVWQCTAGETKRLVGLLEEIAHELHWQPGQQLRDYAPHAVHIAAYVDGKMAGGLQLVPASAGGILPCERVWPDVTLPRRAQTAHIAILALAKQHRGTAGLLWPLCVAMWRYCAMSGITDLSLEVTPATHRLYLRLGWPLEVVGELRQHWGEDCLLCRMDAAAVAGAMVTRAMRSSAYRGIVAMMTQPYDGSDVETVWPLRRPALPEILKPKPHLQAVVTKP